MNSNNYHSYKIRISDLKAECVEANGEHGKGFLYPDISDKLPKLYVVKRDKEVYYVGITRQDIRKRLRYGFSARGEHGYHGYKWKGQDEVELLVWSFPGSTTICVEAIEAELVYLIREKTGKWPKYQMEIHFHGASEAEMQVAKSILRDVWSENNMLVKHELWQRIKNLEGKTIYSLTYNRPNTITEVDEKCVFTAERKTPVWFNGKWGLYESYRVLHKDGYLLISSNGGNASSSYLTMAIILAAVPDEAVEANQGIKLR